MSSAKSLRYLILGMWAAAVIGGVLDFALASRLPAPLRQHISDQWERTLTLGEGIGLVVGLAALCLVVHGSIQLYRLRRSGSRSFLIGYIIGVCTTPFFGPIVNNAWSELFFEVGTIIAGIIIGWTSFRNQKLELEEAVGRPDR